MTRPQIAIPVMKWVQYNFKLLDVRDLQARFSDVWALFGGAYGQAQRPWPRSGAPAAPSAHQASCQCGGSLGRSLFFCGATEH